MTTVILDYLAAGGDVGIWIIAWLLYRFNIRLLTLELELKHLSKDVKTADMNIIEKVERHERINKQAHEVLVKELAEIKGA